MPTPNLPSASIKEAFMHDAGEPLKVVAYLTTDEEGSPAMLFFDQHEARNFCDLDEEPTGLVSLSDHEASIRAKDAEISALKADAGRFQWLLDNANIEHDPSEPYQLVIWEPGTGQDWKAIVRASIDAIKGDANAD
jgi:hypothetical protein